MWPARDPRGLPDNAAAEAVNIRADGGEYLRGAPGLTYIKDLQSGTKSVYRLQQAGANTLENSYWMEFADINTDVVRSPLVNDSFERFYWASPTEGLRYAPKASIIAGGTNFTVGVIVPATAPTGAPIAGTGELDPDTGENVAPQTTRAYLVTFISDYGEESRPSPAVEIVGASDQDFLIENIPQPGALGSTAGINKIRLYRTVTGLTTGVTAYYKVVDLNPGTTFYNDHLSDLTVSGQTVLGSTTWAAPETGLQGLVSMPNGILVSWKGNTLFFCENFRPHAWPVEYQLTVDANIVGLGVFGNTCVVCTEGAPAAVSGVKTNSLSLTKYDQAIPCLSRRSIVSTPEGVYFASDQGYMRFGPDGLNPVTSQVITREQWRTTYAPDTIRAMVNNGVLVAMRDAAGEPTEGFKMVPANVAAMGVVNVDLPVGVINLGVEPWTGKPFVIGADHKLYEWERPGAAPLAYRWKSKEFKLPAPANMAAYEAYHDTAGGTLHLKVWATLRSDGVVTKTLVYDEDVPTSGWPVRLPSGFRAEVYQFELSGTAELQSFLTATSVVELRGG